jgi:hypothetical protein
VGNGDSYNDPRVFFKEETKQVCSILKLLKSFSFTSYSELEETTATFPKVSSKFSIVFLHL